MSSSSDRARRAGSRPTLPPIRDLFGDELSNSPMPHNDSPALTLARLRVSDDDDIPPRFQGSPAPGYFAASSTRAPVTRHPNIYSRPYHDPSTTSLPSHHPSSAYLYRSNTPTSQLPHSTIYNPVGYQPPSGQRSGMGYEYRETSYSVADPTSVSRYASPHSLPPDLRSQSGQRYPPVQPRAITTTVDPIGRPADEEQTPTSRHHRSDSSQHAMHPHRSEGDRAVTSTVSKYECNYCGKGFNRPSSLKIHLNSHTGEKPFVCTVEGCGRSFSVLSNMRRHARVHTQPPHRQHDVSGDEGSDSHSSPQASSSRSSMPSATSSSTWHHHRRASTASSSSSSSRRSRSVSSDSEDEDSQSRPEKRSRSFHK